MYTCTCMYAIHVLLIIDIIIPDYSIDRVMVTLHSDLADTFGNLLQRLTSSKLHPPNISDKPHPHPISLWSQEDNELIDHLTKLPDIVGGYYSNYEFGQGINYIMDALRKVGVVIIEYMYMYSRTCL